MDVVVERRGGSRASWLMKGDGGSTVIQERVRDLWANRSAAPVQSVRSTYIVLRVKMENQLKGTYSVRSSISTYGSLSGDPGCLSSG